MSVLRIFLLLMFSCILYSCKKENNSISAGSSYHRAELNGSSIRVFASSGEIKIPSIVNRFTQTDGQTISNIGDHLGGFDSIHIMDGSNATLFEYSTHNQYIYSKVSKDYNFSSKDTFTGYSYGDLFTRSLNYTMSLYKPIVYSETIVSSTAGLYQFQYKGRRQYFIQKDNDRLIAPWIVYTYHNSATVISYTLQNKLDLKFYETLQPRDTIVLKEYSIVYE